MKQLKNQYEETNQGKIKVLILYDSLFGNTKKVALALDRGLEAGGLQVDSSPIQNFNLKDFKGYDAIGIGGPTHMRGASRPMKLFLTKMRQVPLKDKKGFVFETKASFTLAGSSGRKIFRSMRKMKIDVLYPIISAIVLGKEGPLEENTLANMEQIGLEFAEKLNLVNQR